MSVTPRDSPVTARWLRSRSALAWLFRPAASGVLAGALVAGACAWVDARLTDLVLHQTAARATDHVQLGIVGHVSAQDFAPPHTPEALARLGEHLSPLLTSVRRADSGIIGVDVLAADGTLVASDISSSPGPDATARSGEALADALEVSVPIVLEREVVGGYVIYEDPSAAHLARPEIVGLVAAALAIVGTLTFGLARRRRQDSSAQLGIPSHTELVHTVSDGEPEPSGRLLTARQLDVLRLLATQRTYRDIATELVVSEETVRTHVKHILRKLRQPTRTRAVVAALQLGLLDLP